MAVTVLSITRNMSDLLGLFFHSKGPCTRKQHATAHAPHDNNPTVSVLDCVQLFRRPEAVRVDWI